MQVKYWKCACGHIFPEYMSTMDSDGQERCPKCTRPVNGNPEVISLYTYAVIYIRYKQYSDASGLYAIIGEISGMYHLVRLTDTGVPEVDNKGKTTYYAVETDCNYATIIRTNLLYTSISNFN